VQQLAKELEDKTWCYGEAYSLADIATGCALGYLDLRHPAIDWRAEYPNLVRLADKLAKRPSFAETAPPPS
jgi:glutathione S-transferase